MRVRRVVLASLAAAAVLAACSGSEPNEPEADGAMTTPTQPPTCPLTGEVAADPAALRRPVVGIKVENSREARPLSGLEDADIVFEEVVEGGITRFMALYHCGSATKVGPVRSARFDDPKMLLPFGRVLVYSGGNRTVETELERRGVVRINEITAGPPALFRFPEGTINVHNLFASVPAVRKLKAARKADPPEVEWLRFGKLTAEAKRARRVMLSFGPTSSVEYRYRGGMWTRSDDGAPTRSATGGQIAVPNVLVLEVDVEPSGIVDVAGNPSPDIRLKGRGKLLLFRDGKVVKGRWVIRRDGEAPRLLTNQGGPVTLAEGRTWVELVPDPHGDFKGSVGFK